MFSRLFRSSSSSSSSSSLNVLSRQFSSKAHAHPRKTTQLKNMLRSSQLEFLMEAHNGLSAKIVEEAGFKGIWGSGLSISASMGKIKYLYYSI